MPDQREITNFGKITGLWKQDKGHLMGSQGGVTYFVFANPPEKRKKETDPEYDLVIAPRRRKDTEQQADKTDSDFPF